MKLRTRRHKLALALTALALAATGVVGTVSAAPPAEAAGRCVDYTYRSGSYSSCVGVIQQLLNYHVRHGLVVDNDFGPATRNATIAFQQMLSSYLVVDGIVGPRTWNLLCQPLKGPGPVPGFPYTAARSAGCAV